MKRSFKNLAVLGLSFGLIASPMAFALSPIEHNKDVSTVVKPASAVTLESRSEGLSSIEQNQDIATIAKPESFQSSGSMMSGVASIERNKSNVFVKHAS